MIYKSLLFTTLFIWLNSRFSNGELDAEGSNVCFKKVSKNQTVQVKYTYPINVTTTKFCLKFPGRCTTKKIEYRIGIRPENKTVTQDVVYCCEGFYEEGEKCKPLCSNTCVHGECSAPNVCDCQLGFGGSSCNITCPPHKFGFNCEYDCSCLTKPHCNKNYRDCSCKPGEISNECRNICKCRSSICNPGLIGKNCEKTCPAGTFGSMCIGKCSCNESNTLECLKDTGDCRCKPPFYGVYCEHECRPGKLVCDTPNNCKCVIESVYVEDRSAEMSKWIDKDPNIAGSKSNHGLIFSLIGLLVICISISMLLLYKYKVKTKKLKRDLDLYVRYKSGAGNDQFDNPVYSYSSTTSNDLPHSNYSISYTSGSAYTPPSIQTTTLPHRPKLNNSLHSQLHNSLTVPRKPATGKQTGYLNNLSLLPTDSFMRKNALADAGNPNMMKKEDTQTSNLNNIYSTIDEVQNIKDSYKNELENDFKNEFTSDFNVDDLKMNASEQPFKIQEDTDSIDIEFKEITRPNESSKQFDNKNDVFTMHYDMPNPKSTAVNSTRPTYEVPRSLNHRSVQEQSDETIGHYDTLASNRSYYSNDTLKK